MRAIRLSCFRVWGILLAYAAVVFPQTSPHTIVHTLDGYTAFALAHNPSIRASRAAAQGATTRIAQTSVLAQDPMVLGSLGIDRMGAMPMSIGVSQVIMQPATAVFDRKSARCAKQSLELRAHQTAADVVFVVRSAYLMLYETGQLLAIRQRNLHLLKQNEESSRAAYAAGRMAQSALIKAGLEIARLVDDIRSDSLKAISQRKELAAVIGLDTDPGFPFPQIEPSWGEKVVLDSIEAQVAAHSPELRAMRSETLSEQAMVSAARSRFLPDFSLGIEYMRTWPEPEDNARSGDRWMLQPSVSVGLPLWFWKKTAAIRAAEFSVARMEHKEAGMRNMTIAEAVMSANELRDAKQRLALLDNTLIPQTRQMLTLMENDYRTGMARPLDVLDAQRMLLELEMESVMQHTRALKTEAALLRLTGDTGKGALR